VATNDATSASSESADRFTPPDVVRLMVELILGPETNRPGTNGPGTNGPETNGAGTPGASARDNLVRSIYDPTAGTSGMLGVGDDRIREPHPNDTLIDGKRRTFDFGLSNPPLGAGWKKQQREVTEEHKLRGFLGRFGAGLPRVSDGSMLFLMHLISTMREKSDAAPGGRAAIVLGGGSFMTGGAGSGESNIRKWVLDHDYLEAIIALPSDLFYNTGAASYVWVLSKDKAPERKNMVQLIDGSALLHAMTTSLGSKRNELTPADIDQIVSLHRGFKNGGRSKVVPREEFYFRTITVERPLKRRFQLTRARVDVALGTKATKALSDGDREKLRSTLVTYSASRWMSRPDFSARLVEIVASIGLPFRAPALAAMVDAIGEHDDEAEFVVDARRRRIADASRRDTENVPWNEDIHAYLAREVKPFAPDAWIDESKTKEGCEIPFARLFYQYRPPRPIADIDADLAVVLGRIRQQLEQVRA
jgi:type I restriction enzyme M protein